MVISTFILGIIYLTHIALFCILAVTGLVCVLVRAHRESTNVWPAWHYIFNESVASKAETAVANPLLGLIPVGDTPTNLERLIKVLYGRVAKMNVALQDGIGGDVWPISVLSFSGSRLAVTFGRSLISGNEKSVERTVQVDVECR